MIAVNDPLQLVAIFAALAMGGVLKGATGMGTPLIAVPVMASFFDVRFAVVIMVLPNLIPNIWQLWVFRHTKLPGRFRWVFALSGTLGAIVGTVMLAKLPTQTLTILVSVSVVIYVALRLLKPDFSLAQRLADKLAAPLGLVAGILQGAAGISAPVSVSFLNAMKLPRDTFIPTISLFFTAMSLVQLPMMIGLGIVTPQLMLFGILAVFPLLAFMPVGTWIAKFVSPRNFDRLILIILSLLAIKLLAGVL